MLLKCVAPLQTSCLQDALSVTVVSPGLKVYVTLAEIYSDVVLEISFFFWSPGACSPLRLVSGDGGSDGADLGLVEDAGVCASIPASKHRHGSHTCIQKHPHYN